MDHEIRSQSPLTAFGSNVWSYSLIYKKHAYIPTECQAIKQNYWTMKLGHRDLHDYFKVKGLVILVHYLKEAFSYTNWVFRYKTKSLGHEIMLL